MSCWQTVNWQVQPDKLDRRCTPAEDYLQSHYVNMFSFHSASMINTVFWFQNITQIAHAAGSLFFFLVLFVFCSSRHLVKFYLNSWLRNKGQISQRIFENERGEQIFTVMEVCFRVSFSNHDAYEMLHYVVFINHWRFTRSDSEMPNHGLSRCVQSLLFNNTVPWPEIITEVNKTFYICRIVI